MRSNTKITQRTGLEKTGGGERGRVKASTTKKRFETLVPEEFRLGILKSKLKYRQGGACLKACRVKGSFQVLTYRLELNSFCD